MVVACTACSSRFEAGGYRDHFCPACGAIAREPAARPCPRCELPLQAREVAGLIVDECARCNGLFLDEVAIGLVLADEHHDRANALLAALPRSKPHPLPPPGARMYIKCPTCSTVMNRKLFATGSGIVVDVCKDHGTFFDVGELPAIIEFARSGGLQRAAEKDAARQREQARREAPRASSGVVDDGTLLTDILSFVFG